MIPKKGYLIPRARTMDFSPQIWNGLSETDGRVTSIYGCRLEDVRYHFKNGFTTIVYDQRQWDSCSKKVMRHFLRRPKFLEHLKSLCRKHEKISTATNRKILARLAKNPTLSELLEYIQTLKAQWIAYDQASVSAWFLGSQPLQDHLIRTFAQAGISPSEIQILLAPNELSLAAQEEITLVRLALKKSPGRDRERLAQRLSFDFGWMPFGYDGPEFWHPPYYEKKLAEYAKKTPTRLRTKIKTLEAAHARTVRQQKQILAKHVLLPQTVRLWRTLQALHVFTDQRKKVQFRIHSAYDQVISRIADMSGLTRKDLKYLENGEILKMFRSGKRAEYQRVARKRMADDFYCHARNGKIGYFLYGGAARREIAKYTTPVEAVSVFSGQVASAGKYSTVVGKVRVLMRPAETVSMKQGEILVTWMTTPDFVPAMRKARAIITDEGGITSHAAIVSRELGIPCIIGTGIATRALKSGDTVEMDVKNGKITLLK